ncbi:MAG TPA: hypothetical protein VM659_01875 [Dongiaceae bacterium]|nr:hypothetical protein [Dongiaceae bacterium]
MPMGASRIRTARLILSHKNAFFPVQERAIIFQGRVNKVIATTGMKQEGPQPSPERRDRWLFWPIVATFLGVFCLALLCQLPGTLSFLLIPLMVLGVPLATIALLALSGVLAAKKRFRKAASVALAILLPILLAGPINWAADCVHLGLTIGFGAGQLGSNSTQEGRPFAIYDWSVGLVGSPNTFLIRDMTDEIALPLAQHKYPITSENGFGEDCAGKVRHLLGHYYVCTF